MAKVLDAFPTVTTAGRSPVWGRFCDGRVWEIELGVDVPTTDHSNARTAFSRICSKLGKSGAYHKTGPTTATVQAKRRKTKR
jgi:hypothetical protein